MATRPPAGATSSLRHRRNGSNIPPSPRTRGRLYRQISSVIEGSFLDDGVGIPTSAGTGTGVAGASPRIGRGSLRARRGSLTTGSLRPGKKGEVLEERTNLSQLVHHTVTDSVRVPETPSERPWISFVVVYTMIFFNGCCFTAVVPSVPFYLAILGAPPSFLGLVVSFYSVGQLIGSPIAGWLSDRIEAKTLLTLSSFVGLFASTLYAAAPTHWFVLASRLINGISAGMEFTTELAFIARNTTPEERTTFLASVTAVNVLGFIMGPALTTVLSMLDFEIMGLKINEYTGPGWLLVIMFVIDVFMVRVLFEDSSLEDDASTSDVSGSALLDDNEKEGYGAISEEGTDHDVENGTEHAEEEPHHEISLTMVLSLIFTQFTVMCAWSVLETITSPLAYDSFGWGVQECNILFTCGGAASLMAYVSFVIASKWIEDRWLIVYALIACFFGLILMIHVDLPFLPPYKACFLVGYLIMNAGFMTGRPVTFALYSKLLPSEIQGKYLGFMVAGGSAARTMGPFVAVYLYYHIDGPWKNTLALFGGDGAMMIICLTLVAMLWPLLLPAKSKQQKASEGKSLLGKDKCSSGLSTHSSANGDVSMHVEAEKK